MRYRVFLMGRHGAMPFVAGSGSECSLTYGKVEGLKGESVKLETGGRLCNASALPRFGADKSTRRGRQSYGCVRANPVIPSISELSPLFRRKQGKWKITKVPVIAIIRAKNINGAPGRPGSR